MEVAIDSLPPNILANRILEVELLLGIVSDDVRAIGARNVNVANRSLEEKLVAMRSFFEGRSCDQLDEQHDVPNLRFCWQARYFAGFARIATTPKSDTCR